MFPDPAIMVFFFIGGSSNRFDQENDLSHLRIFFGFRHDPAKKIQG